MDALTAGDQREIGKSQGVQPVAALVMAEK